MNNVIKPDSTELVKELYENAYRLLSDDIDEDPSLISWVRKNL